MKTLGITHSVCPDCRILVPAKVLTEEDAVYFLSFCPDHGSRKRLVRRGVEEFLASQRVVKPAWIPRNFSGDSTESCPDGCGFCDRHEQHLCLPLVEITSRCNLKCPICLANAGYPWNMTLGEFASVMEAIIRAETQVTVLNLSGGEPLLHPDLIPIVDKALSYPEVVRVSISTNGLVFLSNPSLVKDLKDRNVIVSLQFDGFDDKTYQLFRGRPLLKEKLEILDLLAGEGLTTTLTMTVAAGVNDDQFLDMLNYLFTHDHAISMMIQPLVFVGRGAAFSAQLDRLTLSDALAAIDRSGHPAVSAADFLPLPCSHPHCFALSFYLMTEGNKPVPVSRLIEAETMLDTLENQALFGMNPGEYDRLKQMVYDLWSGPAGLDPANEAVMQTLRQILRNISTHDSPPGSREVFGVAQKFLKSVFIHAFQDPETFDLARARRCCNAYPQRNGRLMPVCVYNVFHRSNDNRFAEPE